MDKLMRHIAACNSARLPGTRRVLRIGGEVAGYVQPDLAAELGRFPQIREDGEGLTLIEPTALPEIARALAEAGRFRWRGEAFDVRATTDGAALARVDRGALPLFGIMSVGVHVNGLVRTPEGLRLWVGYRAASRHLDPNKLDHIVAGGVPAAMTPEATLVKEAAEEAAIPAEIAARAVPVGRIGYAMERPEGLRRDLLLCYDLELPPELVPQPVDGEMARFELWPIERALATARESDAFKFNVNLVLIDLFLRHGLIAGAEAAELRAALNSPAAGAPR
jgi:8-oxo-dGTP pyrophosphatase MutT (NUDIX family)